MSLANFRRQNPRSRAQSWITTYGSGSKRRTYTCVACRRVVDTESASYRMTRHAEMAIAEHLATCGEIESYDPGPSFARGVAAVVEAVLGPCVAPGGTAEQALAGDADALVVLQDWRIERGAA